ncbi:hypothetical protein VNO77_25659 [Canavalia gladiata]|uniref:Uncharacterized protein n=1 Tax=Canavalia gladiata TaxID=3824 RepID=A0AAN9LBW7_CANGL
MTFRQKAMKRLAATFIGMKLMQIASETVTWKDRLGHSGQNSYFLIVKKPIDPIKVKSSSVPSSTRLSLYIVCFVSVLSSNFQIIETLTALTLFPPSSATVQERG